MNRNAIFRLICVMIISVIVFCSLGPIPVTLYIGIVDLVLFALVVAFFKKDNCEFLIKASYYCLINMMAYVLVRILSGNISSFSVSGRDIAFYVSIIILIFLFIQILGGCIYFSFISRYNENSVKIDFKESDKDVSDWFISERKYDLFRLEEYLTYSYVVGINGKWGTGKTELSKEFYRRHKEDVFKITVDTLTCNDGKLDAFLMGELEKLLINNNIYSQNAKMLRSILSGHRLFDGIRKALWNGDEIKATAMEGYRNDIKKLGKPVVVFIEDLDRLYDEQSIKRLLDFTERLSDNYIRIVYEYDAINLKEMGIGRDYLEKYIPYVVNLTAIPFYEVTRYYDSQGIIKSKDYHFLTDQVRSEDFIKKELGLKGKVKVELDNPSLRVSKTFFDECSRYMSKPELVPDFNKKTIISFFFMKHFLNEIYEELELRYDCLSEMKFISPKTGNRYSIQDLINEVRANKARAVEGDYGLTVEEVGAFFQSKDLFVPQTENQRKNRAKYFLLNQFGYSFSFMDEEHRRDLLIETADNPKERFNRQYEKIFQTRQNELRHFYHNEKVSRLIRYLHANGLSEKTNDEAVAEKFINEVLYSDDMKSSWEVFMEESFKGGFDKDNIFTFKLIGEYDVELAKSLLIYIDGRHMEDASKIDIWDRFLEFRYYFCKDYFTDKITPEYLSFCYYLDVGSKKVYLRQLLAFNEMKIVGNLKSEVTYKEFIKKYYDNGFKLGYIEEPSDFHFNFSLENEVERNGIIDYLRSRAEKIEKDCESGLFLDKAKDDYLLIVKFLRKNIEILSLREDAKRKEPRVETKERSVSYHLNDEAYRYMEDLCSKGIDEDSFIKELNSKYESGELTINEMIYLKKRYDDQKQ